MKRGVRLTLSVLLVCFWSICGAQAGCPEIGPMRTLVLKSTYKDAKNSIQDEANEAENAKILAPLTHFFDVLNHAVDAADARPGNSETDCAFQLFQQWAAAGALTFEPEIYEGQGKVTRGLRNPAFQVLGLKFRERGFTLDDPLQRWLRKMDRENVDFYAKGGNRANQRVWAATGAALDGLITRDPVSLQFQDQVWHETIDAVRGDGFIEAELTRGQMALAYHMYSLSATLMLESARTALGYGETPAEKQKIRLLENAIGRALCNPSEMERRAGTKMIIPGSWAYGIIDGFARSPKDINPDWEKCALPSTDFHARDYGGDSRHTAELLAALAEKARSKQKVQ